jgi:iron complex transport system substrate-binding protein
VGRRHPSVCPIDSPAGWTGRLIRTLGSSASAIGALAAILVIAAGAACRDRGSPSATLVGVDDAGDTLRLARPAERVVSLIPATTAVLFTIGAGDRVVGRTTWCDWPPEALRVPSVGDGIEPNIELIVASRPDLVVLYRSARNAQAAAQLRQLGIATIQLRTDLLGDLERSAVLLGAATDRASAADEMVIRLRRELAAAQRERPNPPRILVLAWDQPPMAIGRGSFLHQVVELAGARNVFDDISAPAAPVSLEAIAARDPDLILTTAESQSFLDRPEWRVVRAVRERRLVRVRGTEWLRPTPRAPEAVRELAAALDSLSRR